MTTTRALIAAALLVTVSAGPSLGVLSDTGPRAMGLAQAYTAQVRGPESVFWNPANLGLSGNSRFYWQILGVGLTAVAENNAWSVSTYNDYFTEANDAVSPRGTPYYISMDDKEGLLADVPAAGLKMDVEVQPLIALGVPINGGIAFPMPWGLQSALTLGFTSGFEGEVPKDMIELGLFGNGFAAERVAIGLPEGYNISDWNGSGWVIGSVNWAAARPWTPAVLESYLSEFSVGATLKMVGGAYGEVVESGGSGLVSRITGAEVDAYLVTQVAGGLGFGMDFGVAGAAKNGKTVFSVGMLNLLDTISWDIDVRQDSLFVAADELLVTSVVDPDVENIEDVLDNEDVDGDGDADFHKKINEESFSRSLPAVLRVGVAHELGPRLDVMGAYDQAFSDGFGLTTTPRLAAGVEYRLVPWFPVRCGLSVGGRWSSSSAVGMALGPFKMGRVHLSLLDLALVTRGGFFPGLAKGTAISARFLELSMI
jgi:hypothetical protein